MASKRNKQQYKNQNMKNLPKHYNYSSNNAIPSFKQAKCSNICPLENFKKFEWDHVFVWQPTGLPACQQEAYTTEYIAFKLPKNKRYFCRHEPLFFWLQYSLCTMACPLFIHSNRLILLEINMLTFNHGINILYKVLKLNSKQLG